MGATLLLILGLFLLIGGAGIFIAALFFSFLAILFYRFLRNRYWEAKAGFFGLIALGTLPVGGVGGSLLLFRKLYYGFSFSWQNNTYMWILMGIYGLFLIVMGAYFMWFHPIQLD